MMEQVMEEVVTLKNIEACDNATSHIEITSAFGLFKKWLSER